MEEKESLQVPCVSREDGLELRNVLNRLICNVINGGDDGGKDVEGV